MESPFAFDESESSRVKRPSPRGPWLVILLSVALTAAVIYIGYMAFGPNAPRGAGTPARVVLGPVAHEPAPPKEAEKPDLAALAKELAKQAQRARIARLQQEFAQLNPLQRERVMALGRKIKAGDRLTQPEFDEAMEYACLRDLLLSKQQKIDEDTGAFDEFLKATGGSEDRKQ